MTKTDPKPEKLIEFAERAGISVSYASALVNGTGGKTPTVEKATDIYRKTGRKFGVLEHASTKEANVFVRVLERAGALAA